MSWESGWASLGPLAQRLSIKVSAGAAVSSEGLTKMAHSHGCQVGAGHWRETSVSHQWTFISVGSSGVLTIWQLLLPE